LKLLRCSILIVALSLAGNSMAQESDSQMEIMTNPFRFDGFGAQFQSIIISAVYAELHNKQFVYTPFLAMEHNYDNDPHFLEKKEQLINFIGHFDINEDLSIQPFGWVHEYYDFFESNLARCAESESLKKIAQVFRLGKDKKNYFSDENLNIAVHVRRPNSHDSRSDGPDIPDDVYLKIIQRLRDTYSLQHPLFHIYSQGDPDVFKHCFPFEDIVLHINETVEDTFCSMVLADVLVTSASSLSYVAGFLSEGTVYYIPFWHPPLPHWVVLN